METAVARGEYARPDERLLGALTWIGMLLSFALLLTVVIEGERHTYDARSRSPVRGQNA